MIQFLRLHGLALTCTAFPWFAMSCLCKHCHALTCTALLFLALFCLDLHCLALPCTASPWIALPCIDLNFLALTCNTLSWLALPWFVLPCIGWQCFAYIGLHCLAFTCAALPWLTLPCFNLSCSTSLCMYRCKQCRHRQAKARKKTLINAALVWTLLMQAHIYNIVASTGIKLCDKLTEQFVRIRLITLTNYNSQSSRLIVCFGRRINTTSIITSCMPFTQRSKRSSFPRDT